MARVELKDVCKRYGDVQVVHNVDLDIEDNKFIVLVGPSGCGKSTLLRMIAGLEDISAGQVFIGDKDVTHESPKDRNVAMVFQNYALYPHMTVSENMGFSLQMSKRPKDEIEQKVQEAATILELGEYLHRKPSELSGGQRQRVAMGRAIVRQPHVFLFDEPLSNLDAQLRTQMRMELRKMHIRFKTTTIYVTHDQIEAMTLADQIVILKDGYIQQVGSPIEVFEKPKNMFVAQFIGNPPMNIFPANVQMQKGKLCFAAGDLIMPMPDAKGLKEGADVMVGIRPDAIKLGDSCERVDSCWQTEATVVIAEILGGQTHLELTIAGTRMIAEVEGRVMAHPDEVLRVGFELDRMVLFDPNTSEALV